MLLVLELHLFLFTGRLIVMDCIVLLKLSFPATPLVTSSMIFSHLSELALSHSLFVVRWRHLCLKLAHAHKLQLSTACIQDVGATPWYRTWTNVLFTACENSLYTGHGWATSWYGPVTARFHRTAWNGPVDFWLCNINLYVYIERKREALLLALFENSRSQLVSWAVCCACLLQGCMGEELDVGKCWDSCLGFFLSRVI